MDPESERKFAEYDARRRKIEKIVIVVSVFILAALLALEASLFNFRGSFPMPYNLLYFILLNVNVILIFFLMFLVFRNIAKLIFERRAKVLGSKLRTKLIVAFASFALVPTIAFFYVAIMFITNSIDRWFSIQVEQSLSESLDVAQTYYETYEDSAIFFAKQLSEGVSALASKEELDLQFPNNFLEEYLSERRAEYNLGGVDVYLSKKAVSNFTAGHKLTEGSLTQPQKDILRKGWRRKAVSETFSQQEGEMVWGVAPIKLEEVVAGVLVVRYQMPESLLGRMRNIVTAYEEYTQLQMIEGPLKASYVIILVLIACFIFFGATWFGFLLSRNIVGPIQELAEGTMQVAQGDMNVRIRSTTRDEFGILVDNFNIMTEKLFENRRALERAAADLRQSNVELERRRAYMETVLGNITAGVVSFDEEGRISTINTSARNILRVNHPDPIGKLWKDVFTERNDAQFQDVMLALQSKPHRTVVKQMEVNIRGSTRTLLLSITQIRNEKETPTGTVLVLEDLTDLVKAQRMAAWQEVARRIAHEIKNPLTPIQLSAQRLRKRYGGRFSKDDKVFFESTETIVKQVEELRMMVDEFSNFARMAEPKPAFYDVNELIDESVILYSEAHKNIRFSFDKEENIPPLYCDRDQIKRVFINVIDNAVAAIEGKGNIKAVTRFVKDENRAIIRIEDDGGGLPAEYKDRLFEPYFSTKKMGTGLGLAIVNQIVGDMGGVIRLEDNDPTGTVVHVEFPIKSSEETSKA